MHFDTRAYVEPITLGIRVPRIFEPGEFEECCRYDDWQAEKAFSDMAALYHEITHYLQFYGSIWGYGYMRMLHDTAATFEAKAIFLKEKGLLKYPISEVSCDISDIFQNKNEREAYTCSILRNRYYNEELQGLTYTLWGNNLPIKQDGHLVQSSPLFLSLKDGFVFPVTGKMILENYACYYEIEILKNCPSREMANNIIRKAYLDLPKDTVSQYSGLAVWIAAEGLDHIEPLIYFMLLNQPNDDFIMRLGDYTLVKNMKRILQQSHHLRSLAKPITDDDVRESFAKMSKMTELTNPLESLSSLRLLLGKNAKNIMKHYNYDGSWILEILFCLICDWWHEKPSRIMSWSPKDLTNYVPVVNVHAENLETPSCLFSGNKRNEQHFDDLFVGHHLAYCERIFLLVNLFYLERTKCPRYYNSKQNKSKCCKKCDGYISNSALDESCPVFIGNRVIFNERSKKKEGYVNER